MSSVSVLSIASAPILISNKHAPDAVDAARNRSADDDPLEPSIYDVNPLFQRFPSYALLHVRVRGFHDARWV